MPACGRCGERRCHSAWGFPVTGEWLVSTDLSNDFKETVRGRTDIVALIGESVALSSRSGGREFAGLCPFHDDHDPSLRVYPDRQSYRCWVCNAGGDCFTWVMEQDRVEFREALEILAQRANVPIPARGRGQGGGQGNDNRVGLLEVLQWAENLFHQTLLQDPAAAGAREYLASRQFSAETIGRFRLGYHPNDWDWLQAKARGKFPPAQLLAARLIGERNGGGGYYDNFVDRLLFPIRNERGQPVGFGGRVLPGGNDDHGKYWNSPESPVFHKSRLVYGLPYAREAIKDSHTAIVVEGYTDCIALHQAGVANAVASLGTALTELQVATVKRFARSVVLVFDGDAAGQREAERAITRFLAQDVDLRVLTLENGQDPADFLQEHSAEAFQQLAASAPEAWEYKFRAARGRYGMESVDARQRVIEEMLELLANAPNMSRNLREGILLGDLAFRTRVNETQIRERYQEVRGRQRNRGAAGQERETWSEDAARLLNGKPTLDDRLESEIIEILFADPEQGARVREDVAADAIGNTPLRRILQTCYELMNEQIAPSFERVMNRLEDGELKRLAVWIDEQARSKDIEAKLRDEGVESETDCPHFLRRSLNLLRRRREEQSGGPETDDLSVRPDGAHQMDAAAEARLRRLTEFHQRRATKRAEV
ncbi:MAG: DNA primase [Planctomycetota bacterium]|nr:MAG: DNA primase [Planctomycetota bacterium]REK21448.1 MAG: DNA primase [Planctomycetota bacterium]REK40040.1 MAG: DNA primase [Planctomycetota bacterium]